MERKATWYLLAACILWGCSFPVGKALVFALEAANGRPLNLADSFATNFTRYLLGFGLILLFPAARVRPTKDEWVHGMLLGLVVLLAVVAITIGVGEGDAATTAFLIQLGTLHVAVVACLRRRKAPSGWLVAALAVALVGAATLSGLTPQNLTLGPGVAWVLCATVFTATHILLVGWRRYQHNRPEPLTAIMFLAIAAFALPGFAFPDARQTAMSTFTDFNSFWLFGPVVMISVLIPFWLMNTWQRHMSPLRASFLYMTEPIYASLGAAAFPGWISSLTGLPYANEALTAKLLIGGALILTANAIVLKSPEGRPG